MNEIRNRAWKEYALQSDIPDVKGFDYTVDSVQNAFNAGWIARSDLGNLPPIPIKEPEKYLHSSRTVK